MPSVLHFSPAFKSGLTLSDAPSSPHENSKKRKRGPESLHNNGGKGGGDAFRVDSAIEGKSSLSAYSNALNDISLAAPVVETLHGHDALHSQTFNDTDHEGSHVSRGPQSFPHDMMTETAPSVVKGRISDELATLKPPLYVDNGRVSTATTGKALGNTGLRQRHLQTMIAVLHRCLSERDYIRAGRAWAMLLRAEQGGQSTDLRTYDRWGVGAEILIQRESQMAQRTLDHKAREISNSTFNLRVKPESMEKAKEYYERVVLQYPYRKAFPFATGALNFFIAMFSLCIYTVQERNSIALITASSSNEDIDKTNAEANGNVQSSSASDAEPDRYQKCKQVERDTLQSAQEIAAQLNGLLVSPPYSDNAKLRKLRDEVSLWIADLSVATVVSNDGLSIKGDDGDPAMQSSPLSRNASRSISPIKEYRAGQE